MGSACTTGSASAPVAVRNVSVVPSTHHSEGGSALRAGASSRAVVRGTLIPTHLDIAEGKRDLLEKHRRCRGPQACQMQPGSRDADGGCAQRGGLRVRQVSARRQDGGPSSRGGAQAQRIRPQRQLRHAWRARSQTIKDLFRAKSVLFDEAMEAWVDASLFSLGRGDRPEARPAPARAPAATRSVLTAARCR
jgi:hypothetical protein